MARSSAKIASAVVPGVRAVHASDTAYRLVWGAPRTTLRSPASSIAGTTSERIGPCTVERTVRGTSAPPATLMTSWRCTSRWLPRSRRYESPGDLLEVEVGDVGAEVGHPPRDLVVVADDDTGQAREREARDPERARGAQRAALEVDLAPDAGDRQAEVRVVGEQRLARRRAGTRRRPTSWSRCRRRGRGCAGTASTEARAESTAALPVAVRIAVRAAGAGLAAWSVCADAGCQSCGERIGWLRSTG